eukprot:7489802-Pyramimonas_sp.AAC.2
MGLIGPLAPRARVAHRAHRAYIWLIGPARLTGARGLVGRIGLIGLTGLMELMGLIGHIELMSLIGLVGPIGPMIFKELIRPIGLIGAQVLQQIPRVRPCASHGPAGGSSGLGPLNWPRSVGDEVMSVMAAERVGQRLKLSSKPTPKRKKGDSDSKKKPRITLDDYFRD